MGVCVVFVLSVMILCCVSMIWHCVGACAAVPVLHCVRFALCVVLSRFGNAIDSGTGKPGAVAGLP